LLGITLLFTTVRGKRYVSGLDAGALTLVHIVRVPVELILFQLFLHGAVPKRMTFEGGNYDIVSGLTAPLIYYFGTVKRRWNEKLILTWNFICLTLLLYIVVSAVLSAPFPFQQFSFDHPDIALLYFPYIWLPCCIVPLVLFSHLAVIWKLLRGPLAVSRFF
jgi:hypothetical protein